MQKQIILPILCVIAVLISVSAVSAANVTVEQGGTYSTILAGYNAATDGDTIIIKNGTYTGDDNRGITIGKNINITGESQTGTIIDAAGNDPIFTINDDIAVTISKLTFKNGGDTSWGGAIFSDGILTVNDCTFINNTASYYGGAIYQCDGKATINRCTFINNTAQEDGGAIATDSSGDMISTTINNCIFDNNHADEDGGAIYSEWSITITGCNFNKNTAADDGGAIYADDDLTVKYSRFVGNNAGGLGEDIYTGYGHLENATLNWWGSNAGPAAGRIVVDDTLPANIIPLYTPWLVMNILPADPSTIYTGQTSKITVNVYKDSAGGDHSADAAQFFSGPEVKFTTNLGNVGSKEVTVPWTLGTAFAILRGDEGPGVATVTAADGEIKSTTVTILQAPTVNAADDTVGMQKTGIPIAGLILAVLMLFGGLATSKRK